MKKEGCVTSQACRMSADSSHDRTTPMLRWLNPAGLADAINSALPAPPQRARLPPRIPCRAPPRRSSTTSRARRCPTASLSPPPPALAPSHVPRPSSSPPPTPPSTLFAACTPTPSLSRRQRHPPPLAASFSKWWFQSDSSKDSLDEVKQKCTSSSFLYSPLTSPRSLPPQPRRLLHGLLGFDSVTIGPSIAPFEVVHWRGIKEVLEENGNRGPHHPRPRHKQPRRPRKGPRGTHIRGISRPSRPSHRCVRLPDISSAQADLWQAIAWYAPARATVPSH